MNIADQIAKITKASGGSTKHSSTIQGAVEDLVKANGGSTSGVNNIADAVKAYSAVNGGGGSGGFSYDFGFFLELDALYNESADTYYAVSIEDSSKSGYDGKIIFDMAQDSGNGGKYVTPTPTVFFAKAPTDTKEYGISSLVWFEQEQLDAEFITEYGPQVFVKNYGESCPSINFGAFLFDEVPSDANSDFVVGISEVEVDGEGHPVSYGPKVKELRFETEYTVVE